VRHLSGLPTDRGLSGCTSPRNAPRNAFALLFFGKHLLSQFPDQVECAGQRKCERCEQQRRETNRYD
jgi:hypothetical protein